ncbi:MAG: hypothetical protein J7K23_02070 [Thermoproteales archaeon]|nr:hypothetical protein [Thermoproteales archaeon]
MDKVKRLAIFTAIITYLSEKRRKYSKKITRKKYSFDYWKISGRIHFDEDMMYEKLYSRDGSRW